MTIQYTRKPVGDIICGDTQVPLQGIPHLSKTQFKNLPKSQRTVSRAYGGSLSAEAVRFRIKRAFFNEELKTLKAGATQRRAAKKTQKRRA